MIKATLCVILACIFSGSVLANETIVSLESSYSVKETADRFEGILRKKGVTVFSRIDHRKNAAGVNRELAPTEVIIFGNPNVGTPLMHCAPTVAIDLPQKALFWRDETGQTWLSYNNPDYLKARHNIKGCDALIDTIAGVLGKLSKAAVSRQGSLTH